MHTLGNCRDPAVHLGESDVAPLTGPGLERILLVKELKAATFGDASSRVRRPLRSRAVGVSATHGRPCCLAHLTIPVANKRSHAHLGREGGRPPTSPPRPRPPKCSRATDPHPRPEPNPPVPSGRICRAPRASRPVPDVRAPSRMPHMREPPRRGGPTPGPRAPAGFDRTSRSPESCPMARNANSCLPPRGPRAPTATGQPPRSRPGSRRRCPP